MMMVEIRPVLLACVVSVEVVGVGADVMDSVLVVAAMDSLDMTPVVSTTKCSVRHCLSRFG